MAYDKVLYTYTYVSMHTHTYTYTHTYTRASFNLRIVKLDEPRGPPSRANRDLRRLIEIRKGDPVQQDANNSNNKRRADTVRLF